MPDQPAHLTVTLSTNYRGFLGSCRLLQLPLGVHVLEVESDVVGGRVEQLGHLLLRQPDGVVLKPDVESHLTVRRLVEDDVSTVWFTGFAHGPQTLATPVTRHKVHSDTAGGDDAPIGITGRCVGKRTRTP